MKLVRNPVKGVIPEWCDSNNAEDLELSVGATDRHTMIPGTDWEQAIRQDNLDLVAQTPGATMIQHNYVLLHAGR